MNEENVEILYAGTHDFGLINPLLNEKEILDSLFKANTNQEYFARLKGSRSELPVVDYLGRYPVKGGRTFLGIKGVQINLELFKNVTEKGIRYYASAGIFQSVLERIGNLGESRITFYSLLEPVNITGWNSSERWKDIVNSNLATL